MTNRINDLELKAQEYNSLNTTEQQLEWVKNNQNIVKLFLDNDMTFPAFIDENGESYDLDDYPTLELNDFYEYLGWHEGVQILLKLYGITNFEEV